MSCYSDYVKSFVESFMVTEEEAKTLSYQSIEAWDSVGHMSLMAVIEETFNIELDIDDIIAFSSFDEGIKILSKYDVTVS